MSLEELLRSRVVRRVRPDHGLALNAIRRSRRDIDTAKTLISSEKFDWALAVSYNAMLGCWKCFLMLRFAVLWVGLIVLSIGVSRVSCMSWL